MGKDEETAVHGQAQRLEDARVDMAYGAERTARRGPALHHRKHLLGIVGRNAAHFGKSLPLEKGKFIERIALIYS